MLWRQIDNHMLAELSVSPIKHLSNYWTDLLWYFGQALDFGDLLTGPQPQLYFIPFNISKQKQPEINPGFVCVCVCVCVCVLFCCAGSPRHAAGDRERQGHHRQGHPHPEGGSRFQGQVGLKHLIPVFQIQENWHFQTDKVFSSDFSLPVIRSNFLKMRKSAVLIQKTWRGYQCRKNYGAVRNLVNLTVQMNI